MKKYLILLFLSGCATQYKPEYYNYGDDASLFCSGDVLYEGTPPKCKDVQWCVSLGLGGLLKEEGCGE